MNNTTKQSGFTLVETIVAVLILSLSIGSLLSLAAGGFYSVKYSRNQIVASNLLQESLEYIRNTRDSTILAGAGWDDWIKSLKVDSNGNETGGASDGCFSQAGCTVNPYSLTQKVKQCDQSCPNVIYFPDQAFYGYSASYPFSQTQAPITTSFLRTITITPSSLVNGEVVVKGTVSWINGSATKTVTQTMLLTNWTP